MGTGASSCNTTTSKYRLRSDGISEELMVPLNHNVAFDVNSPRIRRQVSYQGYDYEYWEQKLFVAILRRDMTISGLLSFSKGDFQVICDRVDEIEVIIARMDIDAYSMEDSKASYPHIHTTIQL
jgi:hypothetical protein